MPDIIIILRAQTERGRLRGQHVSRGATGRNEAGSGGTPHPRKRLLFAAHALRGEEANIIEQIDRECRGSTWWGKLLKCDLQYYEFITLGNLADYDAQGARHKVWEKRNYYEEKRGPQRTGGPQRGSTSGPPAPPPTPESEKIARREREAEAKAETEMLELYVNNQSWNFTGPRGLRFTTEAGGDKMFKVEKVEPNDYYGTLYQVKGRWFWNDGPVYKSTHPLS